MGVLDWFRRPRHGPETTVAALPDELTALFDQPRRTPGEMRGRWQDREAVLALSEGRAVLQLACLADLWCRRRTSVTTILDPSLFERYTTGDDRIDEDWIVQTNPPSAFQKQFTEGCDALLALLEEDPGLHATHGWLLFYPAKPLSLESLRTSLKLLSHVARTAEREMRLN